MIGKNATCPGSGCSTEMPSKRYSLVRGRPPLMRGSSEFGRQRDTGRQAGQGDEGAAVQRQLHDLLVLDDGTETAGFGADDRRVAGDRHLFADVADAQFEIDARLLAGGDMNAAAADRLEPRQLDVDAILAGRQARCAVDAVAGRDDGPLAVGGDFGNGDGGAGHRGAGRVFDDAGDVTGGNLREGPEEQHYTNHAG